MTIFDNLMVITQEEYACLRCDLKVAELKEKTVAIHCGETGRIS